MSQNIQKYIKDALNYEFDKEAHSKGTCRFSSPSICSATEQEIKILLSSSLKGLVEEIKKEIDSKYWLPDEKDEYAEGHDSAIDDIIKYLTLIEHE